VGENYPTELKQFYLNGIGNTVLKRKEKICSWCFRLNYVAYITKWQYLIRLMFMRRRDDASAGNHAHGISRAKVTTRGD
jgi:hypothetical protein